MNGASVIISTVNLYSTALMWKPVSITTLDLGVRRGFSQPLIGANLDSNAVWLSWNQLIWRIAFMARVGYEYRQYNGKLDIDGLADGRVDHLITFHAHLDFPIKEYLSISVSNDLQRNFSNCTFLGGGAIATPPSCEYLRNDTMLRLNVAY